MDFVRNCPPDMITSDPDAPWIDFDGCGMLRYEDGEPSVGDFPTGGAPRHMTLAGALFPFHFKQRLEQDPADGTIESEVLALHPAQFRFWLLLNPYKAADLLPRMTALDDGGAKR